MPIYFLEELDDNGKTIRVKIGYTDSNRGVKRIIEHVQAHAPGTVECSLMVKGTQKDEKKLHSQFAKYRLRGEGGTEWFEPADEILKLIEEHQLKEKPKTKKKPKVWMPKPDYRIASDIFKILKDFSLSDIDKLFCDTLDYTPADTEVETKEWRSDTAKDVVAGKPKIVATFGKNNAFKVIHIRLKTDNKIVPSDEKYVTRQLLRKYPYGFYIFSDVSDSVWHFVNVRYEGQEDSSVRTVFHSVGIGEGESLRTLSERLSVLAVKYPQIPAPDLQRICDHAFDVEEVTEKFFDEYKTLFEKTKEALNNVIANDPDVKEELQKQELTKEENGTTVVKDILPQKILSQIVFLYFVQKKGWLGVKPKRDWGTGPHDFLRRLFDKEYIKWENFYNDALEVLFYDALARKQEYDFHTGLKCRTPFLNGGLFTAPYNWVNTNILLPDELFSNEETTKEGYLGTGILNVFDRYNFTVKEDEPLDKEISVDPEMLGKVFESLIDPERKKNEGAYYTTREVVYYLCEEVVIEYLVTTFKGKIPKEDIREFVIGKEGSVVIETPKNIRDNWEEVDEALASISALDPAVGSGAFLVGLMGLITMLRRVLNQKENPDLYDLKLHAIENNLYGIDLEPVAADIAKLRLWLSLIVDEENPKEIKPLPNLDYKIIQGDSLPTVERGLFNWDQFDEVEALKRRYFTETDREKKKEIHDKIEELIRELTDGSFDIEVYFSEVFKEKNGFDVVIGNPPYGVKVEKDLQKQYKLGSRDSYGVFIAKSLERLVRPDGFFGFIVSDTFLTIKSHLLLRRYLVGCQWTNKGKLFRTEGKTIQKVIRLHSDTFKATVNTCLFVVKNTVPNNNEIIVADLTRISTKKETIELKKRLYGLEEFVGDATDKYAIYSYPQELIRTNSNLPIFIGSPKLFALMNDTNVETVEKEVGGKKVKVRQIPFNGKTVELVRFGDVAEVKVGLQTGDNHAYLFQNPDVSGTYRDINKYKDFLLTDEDLKKIRENEETRKKVIDKGIHKTETEDEFDPSRYFGGRYIVPHDKGGESDTESGWLPNYWVPTDYYIDWSTEAITRMKTLTMAERDRDKGKNQDRGDVCSRFQNSDSYFKEGLTLSHTGMYSPMFRANNPAPYNVGGSCIFFELDRDFVLGVLCSALVKYFFKNGINHTVNASEDPIKEIPIPITPNPKIEKLVSQIIEKQKQNSRYDYASHEQKEIDKLVYEMYGLGEEDVKEVETWYRRRYPRLASG
jgi:type I restriction-modification system DNA methylase subunit